LYAGTFGNGMGLNAHSQGQGQGHAPAHPSPRRYSEHSSHTIDEEDVLTPLEMPDGSTRFTSNWLPVDPGAGFTIGSGMPGYGDEMHFGNMQNAFFPSKPTASAWGFDR
jgi:hypothetical protein